MANLAVFASGSGSNFQALAESVIPSDHSVCCLICDNGEALALQRASLLGIPSYHILYDGRPREEAEKEILSLLADCSADLVALAGFMKILSPRFINQFPGTIINIHPSLLPKYPGTRGIEASFHSGDRKLGITIHEIDAGVDTGPIIMQKSFLKHDNETIESVEKRIHTLEHASYPVVIMELLDKIDSKS